MLGWTIEAAFAIAAPVDAVEVPPGGTLVESVLTASVWQVLVEEGDTVRAGQPLVVLEAMKMETVVPAPCDGRVQRLVARVGGSSVSAAPCSTAVGASWPITPSWPRRAPT